MKEVKTPRKPFIFYYIIVLLVLMLVNMFVMPMIREASIKKVDYNEFMNMTLNKQIKKVEIDDSQIHLPIRMEPFIRRPRWMVTGD